MTPAVKTAVAYAYATGFLPRFLHVHTWAQANDMLEGSALRKHVIAAHVDEIRRHPLAMAHDYLIALGYKPRLYSLRPRQNTSHYVSYSHPETGHEALAYRTGGGTIITVRNERPYRTSNHFSADDVIAWSKTRPVDPTLDQQATCTTG